MAWVADLGEDGRSEVALSRTFKLGVTIFLELKGTARSPAGSSGSGPLADSGYIGFVEQIAQEKRNAAAR